MPDFLNTAVEAARAAGAVLLPFFDRQGDRRIRVEYKGEVDVVTEADRASEALIVDRLRSTFPEHNVVAEEGGGCRRDSSYCWYVDPLDGTTNFAHGFPFFCVSIGLEHAGEIIAAAVYDPVRDEMFTAEKGGGAFVNSRPLRVSGNDRLESSLLATGFPSRKRHESPNIHFYYQLNVRSHGVRRPGAAALDLCCVAAGRLEGFWEFGLKPWDVAAGSLIVREAGGRVTEMRGGAYWITSESIAASNGLIHPALLQVFAEVFQGQYVVPLPSLR